MVDFNKNYSKSFDLYLASILPSIKKYNPGFIFVRVFKYTFFILAAIYFVVLVLFFQSKQFDDNFFELFTNFSIFIVFFAIVILPIVLFWQKRVNLKIRPLILNFLCEIKSADKIKNLKNLVRNTKLYKKKYYNKAVCEESFKILYYSSEYTLNFIELIEVYYTGSRRRRTRHEKTVFKGVLFIFNNAGLINYIPEKIFSGNLTYYSSYKKEIENQLYILAEYDYTLPQLYSASEKSVRKYAEKNYIVFSDILNYAENLINLNKSE